MKYEYLWGQVRISEFRIQYFFLEYCKILWTCVLSNKVLSVHEHVLCLFMCSQFYTFLFHIVCSGKERLWRKRKVNNNIRCIIITYKVNNVYIYLCTKDFNWQDDYYFENSFLKSIFYRLWFPWGFKLFTQIFLGYYFL